MRQTIGNMAYLFKKHSLHSAIISLVKSLFTIKKNSKALGTFGNIKT